jgi:hypothetical protein
MVTIPMLWAPILIATVLVFVASALIWMVLPIHKGDYRGLPNEAAAADALRGAQPGEYMLPHAPDRSAMKDPAHLERLERGPVALVRLMRPGRFNMGRTLVQWFVFVLVISIFVAYLASRTLPPGTDYLQVFRVTGVTALLAYSAAVIPGAIWFGRPWGNVLRDVFDGIVYGLLTAGVFGWLWPS